MSFQLAEKVAIKVRSARFYFVDGQWYFTIDDKTQMGPFVTKQYADEALRKILNCYQGDRIHEKNVEEQSESHALTSLKKTGITNKLRLVAKYFCLLRDNDKSLIALSNSKQS